MRRTASTCVLLAFVSTAASACASPLVGRGDPPPRRRLSGPRTTSFSGGDPATKGWVRVDDLLWVEASQADAYAKGLLWDGERFVPTAEADARAKGPESGYLLRTDHLVLRTDLPFRRARELAAACEQHVALVLGTFGEPLDLRMPEDPLRVVVAATRAEFERLLDRGGGESPDWGAFYRMLDGTVYACEERRARGGLPLLADLRHELTHAVLDLGRPGDGRASMFGRPQFWAWEGAAVWSEGLGDPPDAPAGAERLVRYRERRAGGQSVPIAEIAALRQQDVEGRHYDEIAAFMRWLLAADDGGLRPGFLRLLSLVMSGWAEVDSFERHLGLSPEAAERRFLAETAPK